MGRFLRRIWASTNCRIFETSRVTKRSTSATPAAPARSTQSPSVNTGRFRPRQRSRTRCTTRSVFKLRICRSPRKRFIRPSEPKKGYEPNRSNRRSPVLIINESRTVELFQDPRINEVLRIRGPCRRKFFGELSEDCFETFESRIGLDWDQAFQQLVIFL